MKSNRSEAPDRISRRLRASDKHLRRGKDSYAPVANNSSAGGDVKKGFGHLFHPARSDSDILAEVLRGIKGFEWDEGNSAKNLPKLCY